MSKILSSIVILILGASSTHAQLSTREIYERYSHRSYTVYAEKEDGIYVYEHRSFRYFVSKMNVEDAGSILIRKTNRDILSEITNSDSRE